MKFATGDLAGWVAPKSPTQGSCQRNEGGVSAGVIPLRAPGGLQHRTPFRNETRDCTPGSRTHPSNHHPFDSGALLQPPGIDWDRIPLPSPPAGLRARRPLQRPASLPAVRSQSDLLTGRAPAFLLGNCLVLGEFPPRSSESAQFEELRGSAPRNYSLTPSSDPHSLVAHIIYRLGTLCPCGSMKPKGHHLYENPQQT